MANPVAWMSEFDITLHRRIRMPARRPSRRGLRQSGRPTKRMLEHDHLLARRLRRLALHHHQVDLGFFAVSQMTSAKPWPARGAGVPG